MVLATNPAQKIIILPGMCLDQALYAAPAYKKLDGVQFLSWPRHQGEQSIAQLAQRIIREQGIQAGDIVGGSSLGGMVAAEIARTIPLSKIILIGSTLDRTHVNPTLRRLHPLSSIISIKALQVLAAAGAPLCRSRVLTMFGRAEDTFILSMCQAICSWPGNPQPSCPVAHIHGNRDRVILPPTDGAEIIAAGHHLIALSHARQVAAFLKKETTPG
ncbi:MAG: hypothetical protein H8E79_03170 [Desulfobulbaceae bacterium]|uniref:Uncharacterized protein n=1 Tax=Candidatus Desulfatifera sulfidica TaxID=2841691 RepID=A0A8J6N9T1_9BACT|nr:hypothetical protein [Candidatus Desulfatifera sulfidica]